MIFISKKEGKALFFIAALLVLSAAILFLSSTFSSAKSVELGVAETSTLGAAAGSIIPASCPSYAHYPGQCGGACTTTETYCAPEGGCTNITVEVPCPAPIYCPAGTQGEWPNCTPIPVDVCPNIAGTQTSVPSGYVMIAGNCVPEGTGGGSCPPNTLGTPPNCTTISGCPAGYDGTPPNCSVDACSNITGAQATVPDGYGQVNGECFSDQCSNLSGIQATIPPNYVRGTGTTCDFSPEACSLDLTPPTIARGSSSKLSWSCGRSSSAAGVGFSTGGNSSGNITVNPTDTTTYTLQCSAGCTDSATLEVVPFSMEITADPMIIKPGRTSTISWTSKDVSSCTVSGPNFSASGLVGSKVTSEITAQSTYTLTCQTIVGPRSTSVTVKLLPGTIEI